MLEVRRDGGLRRTSVTAQPGAASYSLDEVLEETRADPSLVRELEEYGVIKGQNRAGTKYFDETEREIVRAVTELARYGVAGRNLRVFRTSAEREAALLQQILAPALRSRNPERRKEAVEALENLAAVASSAAASAISGVMSRKRIPALGKSGMVRIRAARSTSRRSCAGPG